MLLEIIKWAERHNYSALRLNQATKRILQNLCYTLSKNYLCHIKREDNEITAITMIEPQFEIVSLQYKQMENDPDTAFPTEQQFSLSLQPSKIIEVIYEKINTAFIEENFNKDKMIKIVFPELQSHILVTPKLMVQLPTLCIRKIGRYYSPSPKVRLLDQILKPIEVIMPDKNLNVDRVLKVLSLEEKETPIFFIHLTEGVISRLKKEAKVEEYIPILQAAYILKQFKIEQEDKDKENKKEELANVDVERILRVFQRHSKPYYLAEIYRFRDGEGHNEQFAGSYDKGEFAKLVEKFLQTYTVRKEKAENIQDSIPAVIKLTDNDSRDLYIYREYLISLLERERSHAREEIHRALFDKMVYALEHFVQLPEMKSDTALESEVLKILDKKYRVLLFARDNAQLLYDIFQLFENDKEINSKQKFYYAKDKPLLLPYFAILEMTRESLVTEAYGALPIMYRFFLSRFILFLVFLFKGDKKENNRKDNSGDSESSQDNEEDNPESQTDNHTNDLLENRKNVNTNIRNFLPEIEKQYRSGGNIQEVLNNLHEKWNIKVGEVREILKEKIDKDTMERSIAIYKIFLKSPNFTIENLHKELKNMAIDLAQNKYTEIHDKKALARYIMLTGIWTLRQKTR